jgi:hypothetical protein
MKEPADILSEGSEILRPLMSKHGFHFSVDGKGNGSGGNFAFGSWRRNDRKLEYHFRYSLGLVEYSLGSEAISHGLLLWALSGERHKARYPGSPEGPLDGFRRLLDDLDQYCTVFLSGTDDELIKTMRKAAELREYWESLSPFKRTEIK